MLVLLPMLLAAALATAANQEERERRESQFRVLQRTWEGIDGSFVDFFVPVVLWTDAGLYKAVTPEAVHVVEREFPGASRGRLFDYVSQWHGSVSPYTAEEAALSMDPVEHEAGNERDRTSSALGELYVYASHGEILAAFTVADEGYADGGLRITTRDEQDLHPRDVMRIRSFAETFPYVALEEVDGLEDSPFIVPDSVASVHDALLTALKAGADPWEIIDSASDIDADIGEWARKYADLYAAAADIESAAILRTRLMNMGGSDILSYVAENGLVSVSNLERMKEDPRYRNEVQLSLIEDQWSDLARQMDNYQELATEEAEAFASLVPEMSIAINRGDGDYSFEIDVTKHPNNTLRERIFIDFDDDGSEPAYRLKYGDRRAALGGPGLYDYLRRILLTEDEAAAFMGDPIWRFPGDLVGEWELYDLTDSYRISGIERVPLFVRIADEHELLTPITSQRWRSALSTLPDSARMLEVQGLMWKE